MLQREGWAGAVAQQPFEAWPVGTFDTHRGIDRKPATVLAAALFVSVILLDQTALDEGTQNPLSHHGLTIVDEDLIQPAHSMKGHALLFVCVSDGLDTPSMTQQWKCICSLREEPKQWMKATAPMRADSLHP